MKFVSQAFTRVAQNLFKTKGRTHQGRIKKNGKIHKKALGNDYVTAKRSLKDFEAEVENKGTSFRDILFQHFMQGLHFWK